ncbi:hypothetical protein [Nonomuraea pusilla]|uniref:Uncharacterized protein n=1 Tax=Nonomuraea pusilla TaxID=46177 RepID=A0A1H8KDE2_9ACTN|nr:hypothetical protein [Nonomuraea pusilla]SEN90671.1 hypothetical protein SAMN05660976_08577 [Nonomuraea pusilla]
MKVGALLLTTGLIVMAAEVWLAVTAPSFIILAVVLFALTAFTEYVVFTEWWPDLMHSRRQKAWIAHRERLIAGQRHE